MVEIKHYTELKTKERDKRIKSYLENGEYNKLSKAQLKTLNDYYEDLIAMSRSEETISCYLHKLKLFGEFTKKPYEKINPDVDPNGEHFKKFIVHLNKRKAKLNYINGFKIVLRVFYKHLLSVKDNIDPFFKHLKVKRAGAVKTASDCLSQEDVKQLINSAENYRDKFLMHGLYESGLRKSEYMNLKLKDIRIHQNYAEIISVNGKTGFRAMAIPLITSFPDLVSLLNHHPFRDNPEAPIFVNLDHPKRGLGPYGLNDSLRKYQKKAGLKKKCYPHIMRHSRMTHLGDQGFSEMDLRLFAVQPANNLKSI
ncbi:MAG: tyrosine-type recombinase/integrase, partial [Nanoarchaeota archaeon]|nr:tyrosine-type recombinase/integrase [Nanoarchaeota archaeon]